jgi:hypothetical protein
MAPLPIRRPLPRQRRPNPAPTRPTHIGGHTIRRAILIVLTTVSLAAGALFGPAAASASSPTCSIHDIRITEWGIADDHVGTSWDLKCGGATNTSWYVLLRLQYQQADGSWHTYGCSNGNLCQVYRPGDGGQVLGIYGGGDEHSGTNTWNPSTNIDCDTIRFHATVDFPAQGGQPGSAINYNSLTVHIGGC